MHQISFHYFFGRVDGWMGRVAQNFPKLENEISLALMSVMYHSTLEKYKDLNFRANIYIAQGPSKWPGPLYRSKIKVS